MQARPNYEGPGPSSDSVSSHPQVGATSSVLAHPQPATGKEKGRAMVLRRDRARRVLLRTGDDHAPGAREPLESCNFLPWRSNHGAAERLDNFVLHRSPFPPGTGSFWLVASRVMAEPGARPRSTTCVPAGFPYNR